jgi:hypothetical protein
VVFRSREESVEIFEGGGDEGFIFEDGTFEGTDGDSAIYLLEQFGCPHGFESHGSGGEVGIFDQWESVGIE